MLRLQPALRLLTHAGALVPFAQLVWDAARDNLTFNPIQEATLRTGNTALILLMLSLACTPANVLFGWRQVVPLRRPLGLYAFFYASLHLLIFAYFDYSLDWTLIWDTIVEKRYVVAGFGAFLLLLPLAVTSTAGWQRRLRKRWKVLHRFVYVAAGLAVLHFVWLAKGDKREPLLYGAGLAVLLALRAAPVRRAFANLRRPATRSANPRPDNVSRPSRRAPAPTSTPAAKR